MSLLQKYSFYLEFLQEALIKHLNSISSFRTMQTELIFHLHISMHGFSKIHGIKRVHEIYTCSDDCDKNNSRASCKNTLFISNFCKKLPRLHVRAVMYPLRPGTVFGTPKHCVMRLYRIWRKQK